MTGSSTQPAIRTAPSHRDPIRHEYYLVFNGFAVDLSPEAQTELRKHPDVRAIYPDRVVEATLDTSVPATRAPELWAETGYQGAGQVIAVLDSGVDYLHADLGGCFGPGCKVLGGFDFVNDDADPMDDSGHGTHVAAVAAGNGTLVGVAPDASILAYKVLNAKGRGHDSTVIAGIERAVDPDGDGDTSDHADVLNLSLGAFAFDGDDPVVQAVEAATAAGALVVAAAGNFGSFYFSVTSPGTAPSALTVGNGDDASRLSDTSSRGPAAGSFVVKPEIIAPGTAVCAARAAQAPRGIACVRRQGQFVFEHQELEGTSMAAPHVAGAAALLRGLQPALSPGEVKSLLVTYSRPSDLGLMDAGAGFLEVAAAAAGETILDPPILSFGHPDLEQPVWSASRPVQVRNLSPVARTYTLASTGAPDGAEIACAPAIFTLQPGAARALDCTLAVDTVAVPARSEAPYTYEGTISIHVGGGDTIRLPFAFLKAAGLRVAGDENSMVVTVHDRRDQVTDLFSPDGAPVQFLMPPGIYDVVVNLSRECINDEDCEGVGTCVPVLGSCSGGHRVVVREGVVVTGFADVSVRASEAKHSIRFEARDEAGNLLPTDPPDLYNAESLFALVHRESQLGKDVGLGGPDMVIRISTVSAAYDLDVAAFARTNAASYFVTDGVSGGITGDRRLGNTPGDLTRAAFRYVGDGTGGLTEFVETYFGTFGTGTGLPRQGPELSWPLFVSRVPRRPAHIFYSVRAMPADARMPNASTPQLQGDLAPGTVSGFVNFEKEEPVYRTRGGEITLNLGPPRWFGRIVRDGDGLAVGAAAGRYFAPFVLQSGDAPNAPGGIVRAWLEQQGHFFREDLPQSAGQSAPVWPVLPAFAERLVAAMPPYAVGGLMGAGEIEGVFDTRGADPEPPVLRGFTLESEGHLTDTVVTGASLTVTIEAGDAALTTVALETPDGDHVAAMPQGTGVYAVVLPDPCGGRTGGMRLGLVLADAAGNELRHRWAPGFACMARTCGDGVLDGGEVCDDGNRHSRDGCNGTCTSDERCGNGLLDAGETCDDGGTAGADGCGPTCQYEPLFAVPAATCFDGIKALGQQTEALIAAAAESGASPCAARRPRAKDRFRRRIGALVTTASHAQTAAAACKFTKARRELARAERLATKTRRALLRHRSPCLERALGTLEVARRQAEAARRDVRACVVACDRGA